MSATAGTDSDAAATASPPTVSLPPPPIAEPPPSSLPPRPRADSSRAPPSTPTALALRVPPSPSCGGSTREHAAAAVLPPSRATTPSIAPVSPTASSVGMVGCPRLGRRANATAPPPLPALRSGLSAQGSMSPRRPQSPPFVASAPGPGPEPPVWGRLLALSPPADTAPTSGWRSVTPPEADVTARARLPPDSPNPPPALAGAGGRQQLRPADAPRHWDVCSGAADQPATAVSPSTGVKQDTPTPALPPPPPPPGSPRSTTGDLGSLVRDLEVKVAAARASHVQSGKQLEAALSGRRQRQQRTSEGFSESQHAHDRDVWDLALPRDSESLPPPYSTARAVAQRPTSASPTDDQAPLPAPPMQDATIYFAARAVAAASAERSGASQASTPLPPGGDALAAVRQPSLSSEYRSLAAAQLQKLDALRKQNVLSGSEFEAAVDRVRTRTAAWLPPPPPPSDTAT
eukprot:TRINITY_DN4036_c1_g1_i2.p1 TRINITY_DN4036_c1_g1~~TRINITY_DN4036_c1_g1_i2.p1  ORF type:complete len:472 (+),score=119.28 TRINITY_DN4036_c1_g1_i2:38-1417(+)